MKGEKRQQAIKKAIKYSIVENIISVKKKWIYNKYRENKDPRCDENHSEKRKQKLSNL